MSDNPCQSFRNCVSVQESFTKILKQLAGQMWQSTLQDTLQDEYLQKLFLPKRITTHHITNYDTLFQTLASKGLITPNDLSLLKYILKRVDSRSEALLWAMYEAGFGQAGLDKERGITDAAMATSDRSSHHSMKCKIKICGCHSHGYQTKFKELLRNIGNHIRSGEELSALKLLCKDAISRTQLETASNGLDLLTALRKRHCITANHPEFLYCILRDCGRQDLCSSVDRYVYLCLKKLTTENDQDQNQSTTVKHREEEQAKKVVCHQVSQPKFGGQNYLFCRSLKLLGEKLGKEDLQSMKLVAGSWIPDSKLEMVNNIYDLFILLEERGQLSPQNLSFLELLLEDKLHLVHQLYELGFGQQRRKPHKLKDSYQESLWCPSMHVLFTQDLAQSVLNLRRLLKTIGVHLTSDNIKDIKYLCPDEISSQLEEIDSGLELLGTLEKWQEITPRNVEFLMDVLGRIGRKDLCTIVRLYQHSVPKKLHRTNSKGVDASENENENVLEIGKQCPLKEIDESLEVEPDDAIEEGHLQQYHEMETLQDKLLEMEETLRKEREKHEKETAELTEKLKLSSEDCSKLYKNNARLYELLLENNESKTQTQNEMQVLQIKAEHQSLEVRMQLELSNRDQKINELSTKLETVIQRLAVQ